MKAKLFLICIVCLNVLNNCTLCNIVVETTYGAVRGKLNYYGNLTYYSYQGIPYAESTAGSSRFKPPIPKKPWKNVLNATREGYVCPQWINPYRFDQMSEDCLVLNVYVPKSSTNLLPVLVFIHGGSLAKLSGNSDYIYGPQFFLQRNMIIVTLNFRFGPLGFLSLDTHEASGNVGLKDIILALKWIKTNVPAFRGDISKITIGGHSSGAALVHYLMLTEQTSGLFQQAILISGSALSNRFISLHPRNDALSLAKELGIKCSDDRELLSELQKADVFDMIQAFKNMSETNTNVLNTCSLFAPSIEKKSSDAVIIEHPLEIIEKSGLIQNIPVLAGINSEEGIYMLPTILSKQKAVNDLLKDNELCIPSDIEYPEGSKEAKQLGDDISQLYFYKNNSEKFSLDKLIQLTSDNRYVYNVYAWVNLYKHKRKSNGLYFYIFDFDGDLNWAKLNYNINYPGTAHSDELGYIFVTNITRNRIATANIASKDMISLAVNLLSNFIKFGTPYDDGIEWPEYDIKNEKYLHIRNSSTVGSLSNYPTIEKWKFWDNVYYQYKEYVKKGGKLENKCQVYKN